MIDRPFNQIRDTFKEANTRNKDLVKYVFEKSDSISLWIIGLSIGGISIFANDIGKVKSSINSGYLTPILYLLAISVASGIIYRVLYLNFFVLLNHIMDGIDLSFDRKKTMDTESFLEGNETFEQLLIVIQNSTGENLQAKLPLYNASDERGKKILYDYTVGYYLANVDFAKKDTDLAFDFAAGVYADFFGSTKEKYKKKLTNGNFGKKYKISLIFLAILYLTYNLTFITALFLLAAST